MKKKGGDTNSYRLFFNTHFQCRSGVGPLAYWATLGEENHAELEGVFHVVERVGAGSAGD